MKKQSENKTNSEKTAYQKEYDKLTEIFEDVAEGNRKLVEGLIKDAAFLYAENSRLREILKTTGMIKCHPEHAELQKTVPAAAQYLKNTNSYATVIKTLNGILNKGTIEIDEDMSEFE